MTSLPTVPGPMIAGAQLPAGHHADDPESFLQPVLHCFPLARRAMLLLLGGCGALDVSAAAVHESGTDGGEGWNLGEMFGAACGVVGLGLIVGALGVLAMIQIHYTFEHAGTRKRHFYDLKLARFHEACAELKSLAVREAVEAVKTLHALRRDVAGLDRRLAIETLVLRRRQRDLTWASRAALVLATVILLAVLCLTPAAGLLGAVVPFLILIAALGCYVAIELWVGERMVRVRSLLSPSAPELSAAFDPSPPLEAAVERLLRRVNRHFDRLKGPSDGIDEEAEHAQ
jgi:hypothetical protein